MSALDNMMKQIEIETPKPLPAAENHDAISREEIAKMVENGIKDLRPELQEWVKETIVLNTKTTPEPVPEPAGNKDDIKPPIKEGE